MTDPIYALCARNDVDHKILGNRTHKIRSPRPGIEARTFCLPGRRANHCTMYRGRSDIVRSNCANKPTSN